MDHSGRIEMQADSPRNSNGDDDAARFSGPDVPRCPQMTGHGAKFGRKKEEAIIALLSHRTIEEAARAVDLSTKTLLRWQKEPAFQSAYRHPAHLWLSSRPWALSWLGSPSSSTSPSWPPRWRHVRPHWPFSLALPQLLLRAGTFRSVLRSMSYSLLGR